MASTSKTTNLGLSLWEAADMPERLDFRQDNEQLETLVGTHINNMNMHLTATEKNLVQSPYEVYTYTGDGIEQRDIYLTGTPKLVLAFAVGKPAVQQDSSYTKVYFSIAQNTSASAGISVSGKRVRVTQQTEATAAATGDGMRLCMNESGVSYVLFTFH